MSLPNKLTTARIVMIPLLLVLLLVPVSEERGGLFARLLDFQSRREADVFGGVMHTAALFIAIAAAVTDWLDGHLARKHNLESNFGKLFDPLADKVFVTASFVAFVEMQIFPSWLIIIIVSREFLVSGLRMIASSEGRVIGADRWGKHKTGWQLATIITTIAFLSIRDWLRVAGVWEVPLVRRWDAELIYELTLHVLLLVTVALTMISGWHYVKKNADILRDSVGK